MTILFIFILVPILAGVLLGVSWLISVSRPDAEKQSPYEAGSALVLNQVRMPFNISFYLVALLFLIMDLEIAIVFPVASVLYEVDGLGLFVALVFLTILTIGFVYEYASGAISGKSHDTPSRSNSNDPQKFLLAILPNILLVCLVITIMLVGGKPILFHPVPVWGDPIVFLQGLVWGGPIVFLQGLAWGDPIVLHQGLVIAVHWLFFFAWAIPGLLLLVLITHFVLGGCALLEYCWIMIILLALVLGFLVDTYIPSLIAHPEEGMLPGPLPSGEMASDLEMIIFPVLFILDLFGRHRHREKRRKQHKQLVTLLRQAPLRSASTKSSSPRPGSPKPRDFTLFREAYYRYYGKQFPGSDQWLSWLVGFFEGDGTMTKSGNNLLFALYQKDRSVLDMTVSVLGMGTVYYDKSHESWLLQITGHKCILIYVLLNGQLAVGKRLSQIAAWHREFCAIGALLDLPAYGLVTIPKPVTTPRMPTLDDAWLVGFTDAEGSFSASAKKDRKKVLANVKFAYQLSQDFEYELMMHIATLFFGPKESWSGVGVYLDRSAPNEHWKLIVASQSINLVRVLATIRAYFDQYPFYTPKALAYEKWKATIDLYQGYYLPTGTKPTTEQLEHIIMLAKDINPKYPRAVIAAAKAAARKAKDAKKGA